MICDAIGRAVAFILAPGQAHELPHALALLNRLPGVPEWIVADRGYSSHAFREHIWDLGAKLAIPSKRNETPIACPDWTYIHRNQVELLWARLKEWRRRHPLRENRQILHGRPDARRSHGLDQMLTGPNASSHRYGRR